MHSLGNQIAQNRRQIRVLQIRGAQVYEGVFFVSAEVFAENSAAFVYLKDDFDAVLIRSDIGFKLIEPPAKFAGRFEFELLHERETSAETRRMFAIDFIKRKAELLDGV